MFNNMKKCLTVSIRISRKLLASSFHESVLIPEFLSCANIRYLNNMARKQFYCHSTIKDQNVTSAELKAQQQKLDQQELEKLLSDPENNKRFQILELEVDVMRHNAERVPTNIEPKDWLMLLNTATKTRRKRYLEFLWKNERSRENVKLKQEMRKSEMLDKKEKEKQVEDTGEIKYGLLHNTLFMRIYDTTINHFYNGKMIQSMMFEPKIVFDCGYDNEMNQREIHNCAKQLSLAFASNRNHVNPMFMYFCNFNKDGLLRRNLQQNIPTLLDDDFPVVVTSQSYLDIFPKNELVYLTPHCRVNLTQFDPDAVYIIGALVDKSDSQPLSLAKAKKEGIRMAKFPIDQYLEWGASSSKNLTLDQSLKIMLDLRHTGDWKEALKHVPNRKLRPAREKMLQNKIRRSMSMNTPETKESKLIFTFENRKRN